MILICICLLVLFSVCQALHIQSKTRIFDVKREDFRCIETDDSEVQRFPYRVHQDIVKIPILKMMTSACLIATLLSSTNVVYAGEDTGTKTDKAFELCLSKCVFKETKPPPIGSTSERLEASKTRGEIIKDCKKICATTKEQLLLGAPKKKLQSAEPENASSF